MFTSNPDGGAHRKGLPAATLMLVLAMLAPSAMRPARAQATSVLVKPRPRSQGQPPAAQPSTAQPDMNPSPLTPKQQRALLKANYTKMKQDADELADLAKSLQDELNKSNENVLSLDVVEKADKIEKLAKKIKNAAVQ